MNGWRKVEDKGADLFIEVSIMELFSSYSIFDNSLFDGSHEGEAGKVYNDPNYVKEVVISSDFRS
jgi:hypothetical protein